MKKITKSKDNKVIFGVCGGFGEYFERDPVLFRVLFVILLFMSGFIPFLIAYVIVALLMPEAGSVGGEDNKKGKTHNKGLFWILAIFLLAVLIIPFVFLVSFIFYKVSGSGSVMNEEAHYPLQNEKMIR